MNSIVFSTGIDSINGSSDIKKVVIKWRLSLNCMGWGLTDVRPVIEKCFIEDHFGKISNANLDFVSYKLIPVRLGMSFGLHPVEASFERGGLIIGFALNAA